MGRGLTLTEIREGIHDAWAVALGLVPLGLAFGLLMTQVGFAWWWAPIFSILIYAGSMEFLAINLVSAGVGPVSAAITGFMVNFRHIFYGLTFPRDRIRSRLGRAYSTYALTDESYAIVSARSSESLSGSRLLSIQVFCQSVWVFSGIVGAVVGEVIPSSIQGMEFALVALFVVLAWETFQNNRDLSLPLIAGGLAVLGALIIPGQLLMVALSAYFLVLIARYFSPGLDRKLELKL
ncbi:AzlC family ABC transporter permease [Corynebacterium alimapuense]|uniref:Branched-chain amino acid ABC transporter permease n=1 Tax=Corynebacterium alimapuense TaxID=1576874 RepID=A0A3M8K5U3_9CORY|nr:AzlC family ABC transporter permease [Corynebacterium alimapuense]RNE48115.1 branched-chain amino acid ABC transporter permease [Corynebacterium alimapuense]